MRAYPPPSFMFLALLGTEIAGGALYALYPSMARNSETLSSARVKKLNSLVKTAVTPLAADMK